MPPRSLYVLPFRLYCRPAYPPLMELLKSRYEQNLGGPAFVRACVPIRWEHDDKNLSNACRSCHSMHNNLRLWSWKKNSLRQERKGCFSHEYVSGVLTLLFGKPDWSILHSTVFQAKRQIKVLFVLSGAIYRLIQYLCVRVCMCAILIFNFLWWPSTVQLKCN